MIQTQSSSARGCQKRSSRAPRRREHFPGPGQGLVEGKRDELEIWVDRTSQAGRGRVQATEQRQATQGTAKSIEEDREGPIGGEFALEVSVRVICIRADPHTKYPTDPAHRRPDPQAGSRASESNHGSKAATASATPPAGAAPPRTENLQAETKPPNDWLEPAVETSGLKRFVETIQAKLGLVLAIVAATLLLAIVYLIVANSVYEADAKLLITPIPATDTSLSGLGLIRESADPTLDIETAAQLVTTPQVAEDAAEQLGDGRSAESLLQQVRAEPVGQSNIVAVIAEGSTADGASELANTFAQSVVDVRTHDLHERIDRILPELKRRLAAFPEDSLASDSLVQQITQLESLRAGSDPTFRFETPATPPDSPKWPRPLLTILAALLLGATLGAATAFVVRVLDPRLKREEQLREIFHLPILARIPYESGASADAPLRPNEISGATTEAYRTLRATLSAPGPGWSGRLARSS